MSNSRFRRQSKRLINRFQIRTKLAAVFLLISLASVTAIALAVNYQTSSTLSKIAGTDLKSLANNQGVTAGNLLLHQIELLQSLSLNEILINKANLANSLYGDDQLFIQADMEMKDAEWQTIVETDRFAQIILTNSAADELSAFRSRFPDHMEIFITDRYGGLLAATSLTGDYYQADEDWWQNAYDNGNGRPTIEMPRLDQSAQAFGLALAVPIYDRDEQTVIGILRTTYNLQTLGNLVHTATQQKEQLSSDLLLPTNEIVSSEILRQGNDDLERETAVFLDETTVQKLRTSTFVQIEFDDVVHLVSLSPVTTIDDNPLIIDLEWSIIARQDRQTALTLAASQQRTIWLLAILIMGFSVAGALLAARYLTLPILRLTAAAQQIRDGDLEIQAPILSNDEIGTLAETFNDMTGRLRYVIAQLEAHGEQLEERVAERTAELERQTIMLDVILSTTPAYFYIYNRQGKIIYASPPALETVELTLENLDRDGIQVLPSFLPESFLDELERVFRTGKPITNEFQVLHPKQTQQFEYLLNPVFDNADYILSVVVTIRDITEQRLTQERLWQSQKIESLGILAGGVAHDFNNLLVAMLSQTSLALRKTVPDAPAEKHIKKAITAAERAAVLTKQMLAYSGKGRFAMQSIHLNQLIQENVHLFEAVISKRVQLRLDLDERLPLFNGDPGQMQQIVMNLILNAAEAIGERAGKIIVSTRVQKLTNDDAHYWQKISDPLSPGQYICLQVQDDGIGMDDATLAKIFDPFFTTKFTGRGLGLAAVVGIIRGHQGGLFVTSQANMGATFELLFPVMAEEIDVLVEETAVSNPHPVSGSVLVIDDEEPVREAAIDILELEDINVFTAENGMAGIALYEENRDAIGLVLLDLSMPGLSGYETFQAVKKINPALKIILSSGYTQEEVSRQFSGEGVTDFLAKPYQLITLLQIIQQHLD